jgi:hypothetical protein
VNSMGNRLLLRIVALGGVLAAHMMSPTTLRAQVITELPDAAPTSDATPPPSATTTASSGANGANTASGETIAAQVGTRLTVRVQNPVAHQKLDDTASNGEAQVILAGKIHPLLSWQAGFIGSYGSPPGATNHNAAILDLVGKVDIAEAFHLWLGRMPIPSDRAGLSTVWTMAPWTLPGRYNDYAVLPPAAGPRQGEYDRGDGITLWGQWAAGKLKYYLGVFGLEQPLKSPLYTGRLCLNLLTPEPGFFTSSTYYGSQDVLAFGVGGQHQTSGSLELAPFVQSDFNELNADILFEKNGGAAGVIDVEASLAKQWGDAEPYAYQWFALVSYLLPIDIGIGRFQPLLRVEHATGGPTAGGTGSTRVDAQLGYLIDGHHARIVTVYQYTSLQGETETAILFGLQLLSRVR